MTLEELYLILSAVYPTAYWSFPVGKAPQGNYITYFERESDNFAADNKVYHHRKRISVELLTKTKDPTAEATLESAFDSHEIYWEKTETHLDDEDMFEVIYDLEV